VEVLHVSSPETDMPVRDVWVYRPDVPDSTTLPVLYFLHGVPGSAGDVFEHGLAAALDDAIAHGAPPIVVAAPDGEGDVHQDTEWANSADGADQLETFVTTNVRQAVEGDHPRDRSHRAIAGFSMGGYGAMNLALKHPNLYSQVVAIAGYYHVDDPGGVFNHDDSLIEANTPDAHLPAAGTFHISLLDGADDTEPVVAGESQRMKGLLDDAEVPADLIVAPGEHNWEYVSSQYPAMLSFLSAGWRKVG
jgi:S-formylglutathione hydrolase FrmB